MNTSVLKSAWQDVSLIDWRSLILFRIVFGLVVLVDVYTKFIGTSDFFTDIGVLPRVVAIEKSEWWAWSFHFSSGSHWFIYLSFLVGALLAFCVIIGYQTRLSIFLLWIFVVSLHNRNPIVLHSGDNLIRVMLFWMMFLPTETYLSLDDIYQRSLGEGIFRPQEKGVTSLASFSILLQLLLVYFCTGLLKSHPEWNRDYTALYYALNLDHFTTSLAPYLLHFPGFLKFLTFCTYHLEIFGPVLLLVPGIQGWIRCLVPFLFMGFHVGLILLMNLGMFPWTCIACWTLFIPHRIWSLVPAAAASVVSFLELFFDFILRFLPPPFLWRGSTFRHVILQGVLLFSIVSAVSWNIASFPQFPYHVPVAMERWLLIVRLDQYWSMFSPFPMRSDGWFVMDGRLKNGEKIDLWNQTNEPHWNKPKNISDTFRSTYWRKYMTNAWMERSPRETRLAFGRYLCRIRNDFNDRPEGEKLKDYQFFFMRENTPNAGETGVVEKVLVWTHNCFSKSDNLESNNPYNDDPEASSLENNSRQ